LDTIRWAHDERPKDRPPRAGLKSEKEQQVFAAWRARHDTTAPATKPS
jgi:hypothetical protein